MVFVIFVNMKEPSGIKNISSMLSILGLVLLILFSPCKVRNYIQAELGIPQTKVTNKSQSTISQSNCQTFEVAATIQKTSKPTLRQSGFLTAETYRLETTVKSLHQSYSPCSSESNSTSVVPLYILYQNLKIYS